MKERERERKTERERERQRERERKTEKGEKEFVIQFKINMPTNCTYLDS